jgi:Fungal specific transcription factor domain
MSSSNVDLSSLHPPAEVARAFWEIFKENVDPITKVFHVPTQEPQILENMTDLHDLSRPAECVMFVIYFCAIISLSPEQCRLQYGLKDNLIARYRFGVQQALARAKFLQTSSVCVLQTLIIFLITLRANQVDIGLLGVLGSVALRIAQRLGLHRDGSHYTNLSPFKQEIRRRLWWHTIMLDSRMGEDLSFDPRIYDMMADTKLPRNLNDSDLTLDMTELPESRVGCTDMTVRQWLIDILIICFSDCHTSLLWSYSRFLRLCEGLISYQQ